jgi:type I restriction enzyme M protein
MNTETVSLADIARRTGVQRPAVSNWKRRHSDFPDPLDGPGGELYDPAEIAAWLDGRRIPVNALRPGEPPGTTFGDRFGRTDAPEAAARQKPDRQEP